MRMKQSPGTLLRRQISSKIINTKVIPDKSLSIFRASDKKRRRMKDIVTLGISNHEIHLGQGLLHLGFKIFQLFPGFFVSHLNRLTGQNLLLVFFAIERLYSFGKFGDNLLPLFPLTCPLLSNSIIPTF